MSLGVTLSPYIAWGCLSVRFLYQRIQKSMKSPGMTAKHIVSALCLCAQVTPLALEKKLYTREYAHLVRHSGSSCKQLVGPSECVCMRVPWVAGEKGRWVGGSGCS